MLTLTFTNKQEKGGGKWFGCMIFSQWWVILYRSERVE